MPTKKSETNLELVNEALAQAKARKKSRQALLRKMRARAFGHTVRSVIRSQMRKVEPDGQGEVA